jgi:hypothetical protein
MATSTSTLYAALVAAQKDMPAIKADATNPHFRNQYVSLDHLLAQSLPVLNKHGIALVQLPSHNELGHPTLTTLLLHESGEQIESSMPLFLPKNDPQGHGSALTYARRYAQFQAPTGDPTAPQLKLIKALCGQLAGVAERDDGRRRDRGGARPGVDEAEGF